MIQQETVFVLGAGASAEFGLPSGADLMSTVSAKLTFPDGNVFFDDLVRSGSSPLTLREFGDALFESTLPSIDEFLETHPRFRDVGKAAIARALMPCENDGSVKTALRKKDGWLAYWFQETRPRDPRDFRSVPLKVITFNFDRSFERAFFWLLRFNHPDAPENDCAKWTTAIPVLHIHGQLGTPNWIPGTDHRLTRPYAGDAPTNDDILKCASQIKIISDEIDPCVVETARSWLRAARFICFLGFGYHPVNLERLAVRELAAKSVYGTAYRKTAGECMGIRAWFSENIRLTRPDRTVRGFLEDTEVLHLPPSTAG